MTTPITYRLSSDNYFSTKPSTAFTTSMIATGSFTLIGGGRLAANLSNVDISDQIASGTFNDGVNTYTITTSSSNIEEFTVSTDDLDGSYLTAYSIVLTAPPYTLTLCNLGSPVSVSNNSQGIQETFALTKPIGISTYY